MVIYVGTGGIPNAVKGKPSVEGLRFLADHGLNAMEVEFVQGVRMSSQMAEQLGLAARELGIRLSVHAPYYINLCSKEDDKVTASKKRIVDSAERAERMGADTIAIHLAYYGDLNPVQAYDAVKTALGEVLDELRETGVNRVNLGGETMAKKSQFGTLDELISLSRDLKRFVPYVDWGHLYARGGGKLDYGVVLESLREAGLKHINCHFEGVRKRKGEYVDVHESIDVEAPPYLPLARELVERGLDVTLICESPNLEDDAVKMRSMLEQCGYKWR